MIHNRKKRQTKKNQQHIEQTIFDISHLNTLSELNDLTGYDFINPVSRNSQNVTEFVIPYKAFTLNSYYRSDRKVVHISKNGNEWKKLIEQFITSNQLPKIIGKIRIDVGFFFRTKQKRDLDNLFKPLIDVFKNKLFEDDDMIFQINAYKKIGTGMDLIHVKIISDE